ncbi:helix-turn-helix domain-containing protein [Nocardia flavorosea]|uniref:helix-turn-helix domain-containing protein n=1 Tax=Nocardia flavorosea TaxID=53429 RepID=UPI001894E4E4|nr:helix-turn-helix transcriptional regulator [Nocardia flavorosea]MBF6351460.1 helix-turn-helix domain-containing protein [Nocardia flavorosea]
MPVDNSTTLPRRQLGRYLREAREAVNMNLEDVAPILQVSVSTLSRAERGLTGIRVPDVEALCRIYGIDDPGVVAGLVSLAKQAAGKSWWRAFDDVMSGNFDLYVGLESSAKQLTIYRPDMLSGLFQTPDYARTLDQIYLPDVTAEAQDRHIQLKTKRQALITRKTKPASVDLVVHESVLRTAVGGSKVMRQQLNRLANMPANVTVSVLPFTAGFPAGISTGPFTILDFGHDGRGREISPTVVYVESYAGDMYLERAKDVSRYRRVHDVLRQSSLDVASSKRLIRQIAAREYSA